MTLQKDQRGFTLIEIMIAIALSAVITSATYQLFLSQQRSYLIQDKVAEMQQNLRAAMAIMVREIRSAGFDPLQTGLTRFVTDFPPPNDIFPADINYATDKSILAFTSDFDGSGFIEPTRNEMIVYRLNGNLLQRFNAAQADPTLQWESVAANIDALNFVLLDQTGAVTTNPANATAVEITLLVRSDHRDTQYTSTPPYLNKRGDNICPTCTADHYRRRLLSTTVAVRN